MRKHREGISIGFFSGLILGILFCVGVLIPIEINRDSETGITNIFISQCISSVLILTFIGAVIGWLCDRNKK